MIMNYEKKYKEALENARQEYNTTENVERKQWLEELFSELKESEDERIRKELIDAVQGLWDNDALPMPLSAKRKDAWIAWLEKQGNTPKKVTCTQEVEVGNGNIKALITHEIPIDKVEPKFKVGDKIYLKPEYRMPNDDTPIANTVKEIIGIDDELYRFKGAYIFIEDQDKYELVEQKPADKVEPKFHEGDWVTDGYLHHKISDVLDDRYIVDTKFAKRSAIPFKCENNYHLWTIQDAKDGDVLASELCDSIIIFSGIKDDNIDFYCDYDFSKIDIPGDRFTVNNGQHYGNVEDSKDFHPATKEQRDLLFQKMHEAGYIWYSESKQLLSVKAEQNDTQNPAWSEEDERAIGIIKIALEHPYDMEGKWDRKFTLDWLKSLKGRCTWKPSDGQIHAFEQVYDWYNDNFAPSETLTSLYNDLKKLKGE